VKNTDHVVVDGNYQMFMCRNCGGAWPLNLPADVDDLEARGAAFTKRHRDCRKPNSTSPASPDRDGE